MKKAPEAFRTISEVSELLETPAHVLRFWESKFYQIRPVKRAGGRRYYRPDDVALINGIRILLQDQGLTIRGAQRVLQENGVRHVMALGGELQPLQGEVPPDAVKDAELGPMRDRPTASPPLPPDAAQPVGSGLGAAARAQPPGPPVADAATHGRALQKADPATAPPSAPVIDSDASAMAEGPHRLPHLLRQMPRDVSPSAHERLAALARRINALLDRMSEASGAGRW